jgi:phospholipase/carboxylesterase/glyoxalase family protein
MTTAPTNLGFVHRFAPATDAGETRTLLLLHGTGGNEDDLLPLGRHLLPGAALLSPRGKVLERGGMPRFFRRLAEGVFDLEDLRFRTEEIAAFVRAAADAYGFDTDRVVAAGYSNGANIAASLLLQEPGTLAAAALFHAMVPFEPETLPDLSGTPVLLTAGRADPLVPPQNTERLAAILREAGAQVSLLWQPGGHQLGQPEVATAREWLTRGAGNRRGG